MGNRFHFILFFSIITLSVESCGQGNRPMYFPYDLASPNIEQKLPKVLLEISGLVHAKGNQVYCIQDEKGKLFLYDLDKEDILEEVPFGNPGDYESIAKVADWIYVLRSDGKLYSFQLPKTGKELGKISNTYLDLGGHCNAEGLGYDLRNHRLLIACKGESQKEKVEKRFYEVNLRSAELKAALIFSLSASDIQNPENWSSQERYDNSEMSPRNVKTFNPSGIARQPITGELYVLSSAGKLLLVLTEEGKLKQVLPLDSHRFRQPEGIAFDEVGNLYISNEGRGGKAVLYKFSYSN